MGFYSVICQVFDFNDWATGVAVHSLFWFSFFPSVTLSIRLLEGPLWNKDQL